MTIRNLPFEQELQFRTSRSSGKGGQHVNKTESRVELWFTLRESALLSEEQKLLLEQKLASRLTEAGELRIVAEESRSQHENRRIALEKFYQLLEAALKPARKRKPTRPTLASRQKRVEDKKRRAEIKQLRRKGFS